MLRRSVSSSTSPVSKAGIGSAPAGISPLRSRLPALRAALSEEAGQAVPDAAHLKDPDVAEPVESLERRRGQVLGVGRVDELSVGQPRVAVQQQAQIWLSVERATTGSDRHASSDRAAFASTSLPYGPQKATIGVRRTNMKTESSRARGSRRTVAMLAGEVMESSVGSEK